MKRIWVAAGLALAMILLCSVLVDSTKDVTDYLHEKLDQLARFSEGAPEVQEMTEDLCDWWEEQEKKLALHIRHSELEETTRAFTQIKSCWQMGEYELFRMACDEAKVAVDHLWEESRLSLKNII